MKTKKILFTLMVAMVISSATPITKAFASTNTSVNSANTSVETSVNKVNSTDFFSKQLSETNEALNQIIEKTPDSDLASLLNNDIVKNYLPLREFISRVGASELTNFYNENKEQQNFVDWVIANPTALTLYLQGGEPTSGKNIDALKIWSKIWNNDKTSKDGFNVKLAIATSLEHSKPITFWLDSTQKIDPVKRYELFKSLNDKDEMFPVFKTLDVTHLRKVIDAKITDSDILWVRKYIKDEHPNLLSQDKISSIVWSIKYTDKNPEGKSIFGPDFYGKHPTFKTVLDYGGVCGSISYFGSMTSKSFGVPSSPVGQPGHCAMIYLNSNDKWQITYNISGWPKSSGATLNDWSKGSKGYNTSYNILFEDADKNKDSLSKSEEFRWLANISTSKTSSMKLLNEAIKISPLDYAAWKDKIAAMLNNPNTTTDDYRNVNANILKTFSNYPKPMVDLLSKIKDKVINNDRKELNEYIVSYKAALESSTNNDAKAIAKDFLNDMGSNGLSLASFSFDGKNAGKLEGIEVDTEYSLDGGRTYKTPTEPSMKLSKSELDSITSENGILLKVKGAKTPVLIPIQKGDKINVSENDDENLIFGIDKNMEFSIDNGATWTKYDGSNLPDLSKNLTLLVRMAATGTKLPSEPTKLVYTENKMIAGFIPHSEMELVSYSSEQDNGGQAAKNAIDGNTKSFWHTKWDRSDKVPYLTIKLNKEYDISKLTYLPRQDTGVNGNVKEYNIYTSLDGVNFTKVASGTWNYNDKKAQSVTFNKTKAKYIKFEVVNGVGGFASAAELNLYTN